jgi:hypothetical protein
VQYTTIKLEKKVMVMLEDYSDLNLLIKLHYRGSDSLSYLSSVLLPIKVDVLKVPKKCFFFVHYIIEYLSSSDMLSLGYRQGKL